MIRALKRLTDWLDRRFPPRLVVTVEQFDAYADRLHRVEQHFTAFREDSYAVAERVVVLEKSLTAMKDAIQKGQIPAVIAQQKRAEFVATGRMPE